MKSAILGGRLLALVALAAPALSAQTLLSTFESSYIVFDSYAQTSPNSLSVSDLYLQIAQQAFSEASTSSDVPVSVSWISPDGQTGTSQFGQDPINTDRLHCWTPLYPTPGFLVLVDFWHLENTTSGPLTASFTYHGGVFDGLTYSGIADPDAAPKPMFSAETYNALAGASININDLLSVSFSGISNSTPNDLIFTPQSDPEARYMQVSFSAGVTSATVDISSLTPGVTYSLGVRRQYTDSNNVIYSETTTLMFTTVPEPATYALLAAIAGLGLAVVNRLRKRPSAS